MWGATTTTNIRRTWSNVSIHAPRAGCDDFYRVYHSIGHKFQFTHPVRGATEAGLDVVGVGGVSIHAPRAGCDRIILRVNVTITRFNSRTPCGVRLSYNITRSLCIMFQFTHPVRGATPKLSKAPRQSTSFQFTHPVRGATSLLQSRRSHIQVSIHAPRAGCNISPSPVRSQAEGFNSRTPCGVRLKAYGTQRFKAMFQFTHPVRGATISSCTILPYCVVSIHAPRAGCDRCYYLTTSRRKQFQFTHPVRGATVSRGRRKWRQRPFQFTHPARGA